jgi:hypothetical protein
MQTVQNTQTSAVRVVFVSALSPLMFPFRRYVLEVERFDDVGKLRERLQGVVSRLFGFAPKRIIYLNFLKHESTANAIRPWFPELQEKPIGKAYVYSPTDILVVATLKNRKTADPGPADFEFSVIYVTEWEA